jgi:hypothetical protein
MLCLVVWLVYGVCRLPIGCTLMYKNACSAGIGMNKICFVKYALFFFYVISGLQSSLDVDATSLVLSALPLQQIIKVRNSTRKLMDDSIQT